MARGASLLELVGELRVELGRAPNLSVGPGDIPMLQRTLRRVQKLLWTNYDWPFMRQVFPVIPLQAGEQFYDPPDGLDLNRIESAAVWTNDTPSEIKRWITWEQYASHNPGVRGDPVMAWDVRTDQADFTSQIEVWPTPASDQYGLQIIGIRNLRPLVHDADLCDLDDELIILFAASQMLARQGTKDAPLVAQMAQDHLAKCRAKASTGDYKTVRVGLGPDESAFARRSRVTVAGYPVREP